MAKQDIIIIGGGAAGLMAARKLSRHHQVTILEARPRLGGRIWSQRSSNSSHIIETGAEFIHGELPVTLDLLTEAGIEYVPVEGRFYRKEKGQWDEQHEFIEGWDDIIHQMKNTATDMTMYDFLERFYKDPQHATLRRHITAYAEGFDIADIKKVSIKSLYKEWSAEDGQNFRIPSGYGALIDYLQAECEKIGCRIVMDQLVKQIDWNKGEVTVQTASGDRYFGNKALITIPVSILQQASATASINFTPPLDNYIKSASQIGAGAVIKVIFIFKKQFWNDDTGFVLSSEVFPTWWTQLPDTSPILTGWVGGPNAERLSHHHEDDILEKALLSLASIFDISIEQLKDDLLDKYILNWHEDEFALGAYSYDMPGSKTMRELLNTPVDNTIFFAGEALYDGNSPGTVEAALVSGKKAAARMG